MAAWMLWASAIWHHEELSGDSRRVRAFVNLMRERTRRLVEKGQYGAA